MINNFECQNDKVAPNAKWKMALDIELKTNNDSVHQTKDSALNAKMTMRL